VCAVARSLKFVILQMSGCCVVTTIASTVLHRKMLLMCYLLAYLCTVCALFSSNRENVHISNRANVHFFLHGMQHVFSHFGLLRGY